MSEAVGQQGEPEPNREPASSAPVVPIEQHSLLSNLAECSVAG